MKWIRLQCKMCQCIMSKVVLLKNHLGPNLIIMTHQESNNHNRNSYPHADSPKIILCSIFYIGPLFFFFHDTVVGSWKKKFQLLFFLLHTSRVHNRTVGFKNKSHMTKWTQIHGLPKNKIVNIRSFDFRPVSRAKLSYLHIQYIQYSLIF